MSCVSNSNGVNSNKRQSIKFFPSFVSNSNGVNSNVWACSPLHDADIVSNSNGVNSNLDRNLDNFTHYQFQTPTE